MLYLIYNTQTPKHGLLCNATPRMAQHFSPPPAEERVARRNRIICKRHPVCVITDLYHQTDCSDSPVPIYYLI